MAKTPETFVQVVELGKDKLLFQAILTEKQMKEMHSLFEPKSRSWRGQYQSLAKAIVEAYNKLVEKSA